MEVQDDQLWRLAHKRAAFKTNVVAYIIVNTFLWIVWYLTTPGGYMWPFWPMAGWGLGLAFNYVKAYHFNKDEMVRKEYEKLKGAQK